MWSVQLKEGGVNSFFYEPNFAILGPGQTDALGDTLPPYLFTCEQLVLTCEQSSFDYRVVTPAI
jgi:hypothetical protein